MLGKYMKKTGDKLIVPVLFLFALLILLVDVLIVMNTVP